jgi:hypothetical protein
VATVLEGIRGTADLLAPGQLGEVGRLEAVGHESGLDFSAGDYEFRGGPPQIDSKFFHLVVS